MTALPNRRAIEDGEDALADLTGWTKSLQATLDSMLRVSKLLDLETAAHVDEAAVLIEQAIDQLGLAARPLQEMADAAEAAAERRHERMSAPVVL